VTTEVVGFDVVVAPVLVLLVFFAVVGARQTRRRSRLEIVWESIAAQLRRRHELVAELLSIAELHAPAERLALAAASEARREASLAAGVGDAIRAERELTRSLHVLFAACEEYTQLHATPAFVQLEGRLSRVETEVARAVRGYNRDAATFNRKIETWPGTLVAKRYGLAPVDALQLMPELPAPPADEQLPQAA
jgi:LemA protein